MRKPCLLGTLFSLMLLFLAASAEAQQCRACASPQSCAGVGTACCCNVSCIGSGCVCSYFCFHCGSCQSYSCSNCSASTDAVRGGRVASLGLSEAVLSSVADEEEAGFTFTREAFEKLSKKSALIALLVKNLTSQCKTGEAISLHKGVTDAPFAGMADVNGSGSFKYEGKMTVKDRILILDLVLQPDLKNKQTRKVHAELSETADIQNYSEEPQ
jgi:hypothetical protein